MIRKKTVGQKIVALGGLIIAIWILLLMDTLKSETLSDIHVASFNVHYIMPNHEDDNWDERKEAVVAVLNDMNADIVAFQEMETFMGARFFDRNLQLEWVLAKTEGYAVAAFGNPEIFPITQPIIFKDERFLLLNQGYFFFSETPDRIYSNQWNGGYPYFATWAEFIDKTSQKPFYVFNIHNDFKSRSNRLKTSRLISDRLDQITKDNAAVIVLGDFNALDCFDELEELKKTGLKLVDPNGSTNLILGLQLLPAIDHILVGASFSVRSQMTVWRNRYQGVYPSDHFPISVVLN